MTLSTASAVAPSPAGAGQVPFESAVRDLRNPDADARLRAVRLLKPAAYPEAAVPLATAIIDPIDQIQLEAIAAELNIFLTDPVVPRRRVGLVVEVRNTIAAEAIFSDGPLALSGLAVPVEVLAVLGKASRDQTPRVALEAMYAFGALGTLAPSSIRSELMQIYGPELAGVLGVPDPALRVAAARVIGRLFARRAGDAPVDSHVGDALVSALNDRERNVRLAATDALGALRYERGVMALTQIYQYYRRNALGLAAFDALSRIGHASSIVLFEGELKERRRTTAALAIEGLARAGGAAAAATVRSALGRERNASILLAETFASALHADGTLEALFDALSRRELRDQAFRYLLELAPGRLAAFERRSKDPSAQIRTHVADLLGLSNDRTMLPLAESLLKDPDPSVFRAAQRAAARLRRAE